MAKITIQYNQYGNLELVATGDFMDNMPPQIAVIAYALCKPYEISRWSDGEETTWIFGNYA